jgi:DNA-directed RNA polymerase subunit RPC12/RpoP
MITYTDGKPPTAPAVRVYACARCTYVARLDDTAMIPNRCPQCREPGMRWVRGPSVREVAAHLGVPAEEWEDLTVEASA